MWETDMTWRDKEPPSAEGVLCAGDQIPDIISFVPHNSPRDVSYCAHLKKNKLLILG